MFKKIKYWYWKVYNDIPHPEEIKEIRNEVMIEGKFDTLGRPYNYSLNRKWNITLDYIRGLRIEVIAETNNVTRTRIRNIIWKFYWDYKRGIL